MTNDNEVTTNQEFLLTTLDNPNNPFTSFEDWLAFDNSKGYNTLNYIARFAKSSEDLSLQDELAIYNEAIDEIVALNVTGLYIKVTKETWKDRSKEAASPPIK